MNDAFYLIIDIIAFILFAFLHSFLASFGVKNFMALRLKSIMAFYRLAYNIFFLFLFFYLFENLPKPDLELFELKFPWDIIILFPQFLSLAGIIWTLRYFSLFEFAGLSQIKRWKDGNFIVVEDNEESKIETSPENFRDSKYSENVFDETLTLKIAGPYKVVRHPLYLFTIIFLILRPTMDLFYLVFLIFLIAYFYIGSFYEEKKLVSAFGDQYRKYQKSVPRLFPIGSPDPHD
jgi:methanethiol S-methyltransferase